MNSTRHVAKSIYYSVLAPLACYYYARLRSPKHFGWLPRSQAENQAIADTLNKLGVHVRNFFVDVEEYKRYFSAAEYSMRYPNYYSACIAEKSLEHFIAQKLLQLSPEDVYVDIASEGSPVPEIYSRLYGCRAYAQDLSYESGIHGNRIGGNAASLPLENGSVTGMALHCSFEHFEGDSDSGFIREAARVLRIGGSIIVVPLYLSSYYTIVTDPLVSRMKVHFEDDALVMAVTGWRNRHGRFYDPPHLCSRVLAKADNLEFTVFALNNTRAVNPSCYARFVLMARRIR